jgi:hypothetical protein
MDNQTIEEHRRAAATAQTLRSASQQRWLYFFAGLILGLLLGVLAMLMVVVVSRRL